MRARKIMSTTLFTVERTTPVRDVMRLLIDQRISGVPVVEDGTVVGIISEGDLILRERAYRQRGGTWPGRGRRTAPGGSRRPAA